MSRCPFFMHETNAISPPKLAAITAIQAGKLPSINHQPDRIWLWALGVAGKPTIGTTYTVDNAGYLGEKYMCNLTLVGNPKLNLYLSSESWVESEITHHKFDIHIHVSPASFGVAWIIRIYQLNVLLTRGKHRFFWTPLCAKIAFTRRCPLHTGVGKIPESAMKWP